MTIMAATAWPSNADLIADVHELGYLLDDDLVLDATYGGGIWWRKWRPDRLVTNDLDLSANTDWHHDFTDLPFRDGQFDAIAFDPPYVCAGGRKTSTLGDYHARYGMTGAPTSPRDVQAQINAGLEEMARLVRPGGVVLVKCQDYISSGKYWDGTTLTVMAADELGLDITDRLEMIGSPRPQPGGRRQVHARRNLSTLLVFRAPR